jgi:glucose-6-phosphate dehydrogenase assembly protein OpcA
MAKALDAAGGSQRAISGEDVRVNAHTIELRLADIWREQEAEEERAVTRAALWNVVAHTWTGEQHARASEVLGRASASVPQRTIVVRADPGGKGEMSSWISANCHLIGGGDRQVCSEEVDIVATGDRVHHVPPLVASLLLPDMPVAVWWLGHLPAERDEYIETLLEHADRLIVDSAEFGKASDFELLAQIAESTTTAPADLNWARIEEWRASTAMLFDPPAMRERLRSITKVRVTSGGGQSLGERSEALLYVAWLQAQLRTNIAFELVSEGQEKGITGVELHFTEGATATIRSQRERGVVVANIDGTESTLDCITRTLGRGGEELIVRLLKRPEADRVFVKALRVARRLAAQVA